MRAEANADVKRPVEVQHSWRAELVHGLSPHANEKGDRVTALFNAYATDLEVTEVSLAIRQSNRGKAVFKILEVRAPFRAPSEMNHARAMLPRHSLCRVVVQVL